MKFERASGVLLHPTSLPGPFGIGDLGPEAHRWVEYLSEAGCGLWQVLPLGPTGYGDSPYQCFSAFAGNPYLVSPQALVDDELLSMAETLVVPSFPYAQVDYGLVIGWKLGLLDVAFDRFEKGDFPELRRAFADFQEAQASWLADYALFMALKEEHNWAPWVSWEPALRDREPDALDRARIMLAGPIKRQVFRQFLFYRQWNALRAHANALGIKIIGDAPIFVAHDSADVWANPRLFYLDALGLPTVVAGVPPDYFSPTGQLWGNPIYRWEVHAQNDYSWWAARLRTVFELVDILRLDHFRGFAAYWEVPAGQETAEKGKWTPAPGMDFFASLQARFGDLPIIAEDLGEITPDVFELRDHFNLPGMKVLQFAMYGNPEDKFLPHHFPENCVAYTGTHDNDTSLGWYRTAPERDRDFTRRYLGRGDHDIVWNMIRAIWCSPADLAIAPLQDFLALGSEARMNQPGRPAGNWSWRTTHAALSPQLQSMIGEFNFLYSRTNPVKQAALKAAAEAEAQKQAAAADVEVEPASSAVNESLP